MNISPPLEIANTARALATQERARQLIAVTNMNITIHEVIRAAATPQGRPILRITLRQLLLAQPGWGEQKTNAVLNKLSSSLGQPTPQLRKLTIAWLLDPRAGGRRFMAFCDTFNANSAPPWRGYPFATRPNNKQPLVRGIK
jgi:hypothetical protein